MEKIEALVNVLARFGEELGSVKDLIGDIQEVVTKHAIDLTKELMNLKQSSNKEKQGLTVITSKTVSEMEDRIILLQEEIKNLEKIKQSKEKALLNNNNDQTRKVSISNLSIKEDENLNEVSTSKTWKPTKYAENKPSPSPVECVKVSPYYCKESNNNSSVSPLPNEWWKELQISEYDKDTQIDWSKEFAEREELQCSLMFKEGWKKTNSTYEELEDMLWVWTGRCMNWTVVKQGRAKNGKALFNVKFDKLEDRQRIYDMRKQIAEEGYLFVGEALAYVERRERWIMLTVADQLRIQGRNVDFENRKICVDCVWWKYVLGKGWTKV